ncbi:MAG TPA: ice-binding family protein [Prolixibacteraceae bacterium]|nr:ice-binding family protein [Prolixibacteraceae bacterium]
MKLIKVIPIVALLLVGLISGCEKDDNSLNYPEGTSSEPTSNAEGVSRNKAVSFTFKESMDPTTINTSTFTLMQGEIAVDGAVTYSGTTATFTPTEYLEAGTTYDATVTTGAKNLAGNSLASDTKWSFTTVGSTSELEAVNIGSAGNYVILAKSAINNSSTSVITGDLGLSPAATSYITGLSLTDATGYAETPQVIGRVYAADMADPTPINLTTAVNDMITGYNDASGRPNPDFTELGTGNIGGKTLEPGLYKWTNSVTIPAKVTIKGDTNDVFIFQIAGDLTLSSSIKMILNDGVQAKNIFWQVAGTVILESTSHFEGIILSKTNVTLQTGASMNGRALAQTSVVLDKNIVTMP